MLIKLASGKFDYFKEEFVVLPTAGNQGSSFSAKFTADFIFSGKSRNFNCHFFDLKHSFSKLTEEFIGVL